MGIKSSIIAFALCATTSLSAFHTNGKEFVNYVEKNTHQITQSAQARQPKEIEKLTAEMLQNSNDFHNFVLLESNQFIYNWAREDSMKTAEYLAVLANHIKEKQAFFKDLKNRRKDFNLSKQCQHDIRDIQDTLVSMQSQVQNYINLTYKGLEAKHLFNAFVNELNSDNSPIVLDDYWYSDDLDDKTLFISSKYISENESDKIFDIEDQLTDSLLKFVEMKSKMNMPNLPKIDIFDFNAVSKQHFDRVSVI